MQTPHINLDCGKGKGKSIAIEVNHADVSHYDDIIQIENSLAAVRSYSLSWYLRFVPQPSSYRQSLNALQSSRISSLYRVTGHDRVRFTIFSILYHSLLCIESIFVSSVQQTSVKSEKVNFIFWKLVPIKSLIWSFQRVTVPGASRHGEPARGEG